MSANLAAPFWRAAGMTYITYSNIYSCRLPGKRALLQSLGVVSSNLHDDIVQIEHKVMPTNNDIDRLDEMVEDLKQRKDDVMTDDYIGFKTIEALFECILHLSVAIAQLNQKSFILQMGLGNVKEDVIEMNRFANAVLVISTNE